MNVSERAVAFDCEGESLVGIATLPSAPRSLGLVVLVGGPQYRVGSHRQFTLMCRRAAQAGYPSFRFDYRGMGDSTGPYEYFESVDADVAAAITQLQAFAPEVRHVVLWGLCTAASTAMMYAPADPRIAGLVLLNPWVRDEATSARTQLRHYYTARVFEREFWNKVMSGKFDVRASVVSLLQSIRNSLRRFPKIETSAHLPFQTRMARALAKFKGRSLLLISGADLTAKEFLHYSSTHPEWRGVLQSPKIARVDFPEADHTFSNATLRKAVEDATVDWLATF
jgi:uncharacterized protein